MKKIYALLALATLLSPVTGRSQVTVTSGATALQLASELTGGGVTVTSPTLTCASNAEGIFTGPSSLSFDSGIVLTSGTAATSGTTYGAFGPASNFASTANGTPGDPDLTTLAGLTTYDACVLEFDFQPAGDTVKFNYVFGSEEYTDFTCSSFNDVFGFFISGPGYASATNIALVPGTTIPVCINSVNCGATGGYSTSTCSALGPGAPFCAYYVNNLTGTSITYDGITTTLTAIAAVSPCNTYHLKIGIADGSDEAFDSGVFIQAGSLTSTGIAVTPVGADPTDTSLGNQYCVRGCLPGVFNFATSAPVAGGLTIHYTIGGTAINGTDYSTIADSVVVPPGGSSANVIINGLPALSGGTKSVTLYILAPYTCSGVPVIIDSATILIIDGFPVNIITPDTSICLGSSFTMNATGDPHLHFMWTPASGGISNDTLLNPTVSPTTTTTYTLTGTMPGSGCPPSTDVETVTVIQNLSLTVGPAIQNTCVGVPLPLNVIVSPSAGSYSYNWTPSTWLSSGIVSNPTVTPGAAGNYPYHVSVIETTAGCTVSDSFILHVLPNDFTLNNQDSGICFYDVIPVSASGDTEFAYHWQPASQVSNPDILAPWLTVNTSTTFTVTATYPGCPDMVHTVSYYVESPHVDILTPDTMFCIYDTVHLRVLVTPADSPYVFSWSPTTNLYDGTMLEPVFTSGITGDYPYSLTIQSPLGCTSSDHVTLSPRPLAQVTASAVSPGVTYGGTDQLDATDLTAFPLVYWWTPDDGSLSNPNINNPVATPAAPTTYVVHAMNEWGCKDSASVFVDVTGGDDGTVVPMAFTPNNDGLNDVYRLVNMHNKKLVEFNIFNRWGQLLYHNSTDVKAGWDGTFNGQPQDIGTYQYDVIVAMPDGTNREFKGNLTLLR